MSNVYRQEIWWVDLDPPGEGIEIHKTRPALIVSVDQINNGPAGLVIIIPLTSTRTGIPFHIQIAPPEGGLNITSYIKCDQIRMISTKRLKGRLGKISGLTMSKVEEALRFLMDL